MNNKILIGIVAILVVIGGGYAFTYNNITQAANEVFNSYSDGDETIEVIDFTLFPPSATIEIRVPVENPTQYSFTFSIDADFYLNDVYVDEVHISEEIIANGRSVLVIPMYVGPVIMEATMEDEDAEWDAEGTTKISTKMFGIIPVTITRTLPIE